MKKRFVKSLPLALMLLATAPAFAQVKVENAGFETGSSGQPPIGWFVPPITAQGGYQVAISTENPKEGKQCVVIASANPNGQGFGNMMQTIDATPYRGRKFRFRAAARMESGGGFGQAALWFRVDRTNGQQGFFNNMSDRPIRSGSWAFYEISGKIDADAETINIGMMLMGSGRAFFDSVSLTIGDTAPEEPIVKPRALAGRGLDNLVAYTKLLGYVRHFHPSDAVEKADWDRMAMAGVPVAEEAKDPADLAERLQKFFAPIAPTVRVYVTGQKPTTPAVPKDPTANGIVTWDNTGFGGGNIPAGQSVYHSKRVFAPKSATSTDPASTFVADLGGGVSCEVPLVLYARNGAALPRTVDPVVPPGTRSEPTGNDRTTRLAAVALDWNVYEHFYPYFDVVKVDWNDQLRQALTSAATDSDERAFLTTLRRLTAAAHDGHGYVGHPSDDARAVPPFIADWVEGKFVITQVGKNAGRLQAGDEIVKIDGTSAEDLWKATEPLISGATEGWRRSRGRIEMLRGVDGSSMELEIRRGSGPTFTASVARAMGNMPEEKRPKPIEELKLGIWYVDLDGSRANMEAYQKALHDLTGADAVIFDLRGYPNEVAMDALRRTAKTPIVSALWNVPQLSKPDRQGVSFLKSQWPPAPPLVPRFRGKVIFLTGSGAISYAESVMGIVENYKLGDIVGETTAGTNGNINPFGLPGGYTVIFTGMKVLKHDGSTHHGVGIKPTVEVHRTIAGVTAGKDEVLEKAIQLAKG